MATSEKFSVSTAAMATSAFYNRNRRLAHISDAVSIDWNQRGAIFAAKLAFGTILGATDRAYEPHRRRGLNFTGTVS